MIYKLYKTTYLDTFDKCYKNIICVIAFEHSETENVFCLGEILKCVIFSLTFSLFCING